VKVEVEKKFVDKWGKALQEVTLFSLSVCGKIKRTFKSSLFHKESFPYPRNKLENF